MPVDIKTYRFTLWLSDIGNDDTVKLLLKYRNKLKFNEIIVAFNTEKFNVNIF